MSRCAFKFVAHLYPRPWRERYGDELHDLCQELLNAGQTTRLRLALAILAGAVAERARRLRSTCGRAMAVCSMVLIIGFSAATLATNGLGLVTGQEANGAADIGASAIALVPTAQFHLGRGYAEATSSIREPGGVMVWGGPKSKSGQLPEAFALLQFSCRLRPVVNTQCRTWGGKST